MGILQTCLAKMPDLYFNRITLQDGLSHNKVNCILQDKRGFIWIGTEDGLNRYDGNYFTVFRNQPGNASSLSGNIITSLHEDGQGVMWIGTADGGLTKYDYRLPAAKQFKQYKHIPDDSSSIPVNIINAVLPDNKGCLWLATGGYFVIRFNKQTEQFDMPFQYSKKVILSMCLDRDSNLYAGGQGGSLYKINTHTLEYEMDRRYLDLYARLPHASITALHCDNDGNIWFGSWDNILYRYNPSTKQEDAFSQTTGQFTFPNDEVRSFYEDKHGRLWMGGRYAGLTVYDKGRNKFYNYRKNPAHDGSLADNQINCIYIDEDGIVWLGTNKGISIYNPLVQSFEQNFLPSRKSNITIYDFYHDQHGQIWIATSEGIYMRDVKGGSLTYKEVKYNGVRLEVTKFFKDVDNSFYIGSDYSLFKYDPVTNTVTLLQNTGKDAVMKKIIDSRVMSIVKDTLDGHPVLMVAPYGHYIAYYDFTEQRWISRIDTVKNIISHFNLKDYLIRKIYKSGDGRLWLATARYGLGEWNYTSGPQIRYHGNNPASQTSISNDNVYDILEDSAGNLWISTYGGGLNYYNRYTQQFAHINSTNNLLEGIAADEKGNVWMISNGNIQKYDPVSNTCASFVLPDLEKTGGVKGNIYTDRDGFMYVSGSNYFIRFDPGNVQTPGTNPQVHFTGFKIFNNSVDEYLLKDKIRLLYYENYFTIEFAAPDFTDNTIEYAYMLDGFDKEWINIGRRNFVNYSNLPVGDYVFKVRASNNKGNWSSDFAAMQITIIPPFWKQMWFYILSGLLLSAIIFGFYRYRINELLKRQAIRNKIAQDLHDSLGSTLSSISVYSQVAKIFHQQHKDYDLSLTLEKIGYTSGEMISEMADIVWAINPKNDRLDSIILRMESFSKPLLQVKNIDFRFNYSIAQPGINLQLDKRKNFYLIFKEAINNALKYADCKHLDVRIVQHGHIVELTIADDGRGFDSDAIDISASRSLSGNGLKNMQMRAGEMNATFSITSKPGKGTTVFLAFHIP